MHIVNQGHQPSYNHPLSVGTSMLLALVGGLVVALLIDHGESLYRYILDASTYRAQDQVNGQTMEHTVSPPRWWVWLAYGCYVLNVFRQIHGLFLVRDENSYFAPVFDETPHWGQVASFWFLLGVLTIPCVLIVHVESVCTKAQESLTARPLPVLIAYFTTGLAYVLWDVLTGVQLWLLERRLATLPPPDNRREKERRSSLKDRVSALKRCVTRWVLMYCIALALCLLAFRLCAKFGSTFSETDSLGRTSEFSLRSTIFPWIVVLLAGGYFVGDYAWNRLFYFGPASHDNQNRNRGTVS